MEGLAQNFGIDWKLLAAQAVNFGVLLLVLWRFAYRPILAMLRKRREDVEKGISDAKAAAEKLAGITTLQEERLLEARHEALAIISRAQVAARVEKGEMIAQAEKKGAALIAEAKRALAEEKAKLSEELEREARELVRDGVARVLGKMPPQERDRELIEQAIRAMKT